MSIGDFDALRELDPVYGGYHVSGNNNSDNDADVTIGITTSTADGDTSKSDMSRMFETMKSDILSNGRFSILTLKRCYEMKITYCTTCDESNLLYSIVFELLRNELLSLLVNGSSTQENRGNVQNQDYHTSVFEHGQYFYTAMLFLLYTQATIHHHHCHQCGQDWIEHICQFGKNLQLSHVSNQHDDNNNNTDIKGYIRQMIDKYLPETISVTVSGYGSKTHSVSQLSVSIIEICHQLNQQFVNYIFTRAYSYSLATAKLATGVNSQTCDSISLRLAERKICNLNIKGYGNDYERALSNLEIISNFDKEYKEDMFELEGMLDALSLHPRVHEMKTKLGKIPIIHNAVRIEMMAQFKLGEQISEVS